MSKNPIIAFFTAFGDPEFCITLDWLVVFMYYYSKTYLLVISLNSGGYNNMCYYCLIMHSKIVFRRRIVKSGNSYQVVIPPEIFEGLNLKIHQPVIVESTEYGILIRPEGIKND